LAQYVKTAFYTKRHKNQFLNEKEMKFLYNSCFTNLLTTIDISSIETFGRYMNILYNNLKHNKDSKENIIKLNNLQPVIIPNESISDKNYRLYFYFCYHHKESMKHLTIRHTNCKYNVNYINGNIIMDFPRLNAIKIHLKNSENNDANLGLFIFSHHFRRLEKIEFESDYSVNDARQGEFVDHVSGLIQKMLFDECWLVKLQLMKQTFMLLVMVTMLVWRLSPCILPILAVIISDISFI
jgi:hypothetical protein